jgi:hypothetical protein
MSWDRVRPQVLAVIIGIVIIAGLAMKFDGLEELKIVSIALGPVAMAIINKQKSED